MPDHLGAQQQVTELSLTQSFLRNMLVAWSKRHLAWLPQRMGVIREQGDPKQLVIP